MQKKENDKKNYSLWRSSHQKIGVHVDRERNIIIKMIKLVHKKVMIFGYCFNS